MVAPINATQTLELDGESFTLRFNFAAMERTSDAGVSFSDAEAMQSPVSVAKLMCAFLVEDHPEITPEVCFAMFMRDTAACQDALGKLFEKVQAKPVGNGMRAAPRRKKKA